MKTKKKNGKQVIDELQEWIDKMRYGLPAILDGSDYVKGYNQAYIYVQTKLIEMKKEV